jgi:hypothetical protein
MMKLAVKKSEMQTTHHKESSVFDKAFKGDLSKLFNETYQGNVFKLAVTDNAVDVVGPVATYSFSNYGREDPNNNCVESTTGIEDNTKRLAVITIASEG